jgi:mannose-6-phosphate isomerase
MQPSDLAAIRAASDRAFAWLHDFAWPLWLAHGIDRQRGGFHEHLTLDTLSCNADFRRLRVVTRQIYVFSEAVRAGLTEAREAVDLGIHFLRRYAHRSDGGYAWRFAVDGTVIDDRRDLYDHAFVLLALASAARVMQDDQLKFDVFALDDYLQLNFRHPHGGYVESLPASWPRRQNPHMHLLEAYLAAAEVFDDTRFMNRADELVDLFLTKFFQPTGALGEFFDDQLNVQLEEGRFVVEPGHHAEWVWLLHWHQSFAGKAGHCFAPRVAEAGAALARFMDSYGSGAGGLMDEVWSDGAPRTASCRLWP